MSPSFSQFGDFVNFDESKFLLVSSPVLGSTEDKKLNLPHYYVNTDVSFDFTPRSRGVVVSVLAKTRRGLTFLFKFTV